MFLAGPSTRSIIGHLRTAFELLHTLDLEEIRFVPCRNPHDQKSPTASTDLRLQMVCEAVASEPAFHVDERELNRDGPSYSVDTLESLRETFPGRVLVLIVGMDAFSGFTSWHRWQDILQLAHIAVVRRPGSGAPPAQIENLDRRARGSCCVGSARGPGGSHHHPGRDTARYLVVRDS